MSFFTAEDVRKLWNKHSTGTGMDTEALAEVLSDKVAPLLERLENFKAEVTTRPTRERYRQMQLKLKRRWNEMQKLEARVAELEADNVRLRIDVSKYAIDKLNDPTGMRLRMRENDLKDAEEENGRLREAVEKIGSITGRAVDDSQNLIKAVRIAHAALKGSDERECLICEHPHDPTRTEHHDSSPDLDCAKCNGEKE